MGGIFGGARLINCSAQSARPISRGFFTSKSIGDNQRHFNQERDTWLNLEPGTCSQLEWLINQLKATSNWTTSKHRKSVIEPAKIAEMAEMVTELNSIEWIWAGGNLKDIRRVHKHVDGIDLCQVVAV